ncbi:unnamed protein product, partial [Amoebophrya sp. A25]
EGSAIRYRNHKATTKGPRGSTFPAVQAFSVLSDFGCKRCIFRSKPIRSLSASGLAWGHADQTPKGETRDSELQTARGRDTALGDAVGAGNGVQLGSQCARESLCGVYTPCCSKVIR